MPLISPVPLEPLASLGPVHFIAAGGSGMSGIARLYAELGIKTSGSDRSDSTALRNLARAGVTTYVGHDAAQLGDARTVVIDFQVTAPAGRDVACALEALDADHGVVGWRIVQLPASDQPARAFRESIPTVALATTGLVNACWVT